VTGCVLEVVSTHFKTTLAKQNQPHTIALHLEFLRRTQEGPAIFKVDDVKLGRQTSVVHVRMSQDGREEILAYVINSNIAAESGYSMDTEYKLNPPRPPVDFAKLKENKDENWVQWSDMPLIKFRKAAAKVKWHLPRKGQPHKSITDEWLCFSDGTRFNQSSLGFVADMFPSIVETYKPKGSGANWYPTLLLNMDIKKALPAEGVEWLSARVQMKQVKNGRMDIDLQIHDMEGDLIAVSHHVALILDASRNTAARTTKDTKL